ncbi:MAG: hypothetical protein JW795_06235 [Chitinivibrionales bacterium]|nr:hypothetical protein [Chitinivibrionales bacterium]
MKLAPIFSRPQANRIISKMVIVLCALIALSAEPGAIKADFLKIADGSTNDTVQGTVYSLKSKLFVKIILPISQLMIIDSLSTLLYYPGDRKAITIRRKTQPLLPLFQTFISMLGGGRLEPHADYTIVASARRNDSLLTTWNYVDKNKKIKGRLEMIFVDNRPASVTAYDHRSKKVSSVLYGLDTLVAGRHVPRHIVTLDFRGAKTAREEAFFSNLGIDEPIPDEISNFKLPADVSAQEIQW